MHDTPPTAHDENTHLVGVGSAGPVVVSTRTSADGSLLRLLTVGGTVQSVAFTDERYTMIPYPYPYLYDLAFLICPQAREVCMLGAGGLSYPRHLIATRPDVSMVALENDPLVLRAAKDWFFLDRLESDYRAQASGRLKLVREDARIYLEQRRERGELFDVVMNDAFLSDAPAPGLASAEFAQLVHEVLRPGGIYLTNVVGALAGPASRITASVATALASAFAHVAVVPVDSLGWDEDLIEFAEDDDEETESAGSVEPGDKSPDFDEPAGSVTPDPDEPDFDKPEPDNLMVIASDSDLSLVPGAVAAPAS